MFKIMWKDGNVKIVERRPFSSLKEAMAYATDKATEEEWELILVEQTK